MIQERGQGWAPPLPASIGTFNNWLRSTAETAELHSMSSPKSSRLESNTHLYINNQIASDQLLKSLYLFRKCLRHARSCWNTTFSNGRPLQNHPAPQASPLLLPASTEPCPCWAADTHPPPSATVVHPQSRVTASPYCAHWRPTPPSGRYWYCRVSSVSSLSTICDVGLEP